MRTWTHVEYTSRFELCAHPLGSSKTKVGKGYPSAIVKAQYIFRLQVAVVYPKGVTMFDGVEELQEHVFDQSVMPEVSALVQDLNKEILIRGVFHDHVHVLVIFSNAIESSYAGMGGRELVECNFANVSLTLSLGSK